MHSEGFNLIYPLNRLLRLRLPLLRSSLRQGGRGFGIGVLDGGSSKFRLFCDSELP